MTEPKVSERMQTLITRAFLSTHCYECTCDGEKNPTIETRDRLTLVSAIAEIEQRAEKAERLLAEHVRKYRTLPDGSDAKHSALEEERNKWKAAAVAWKPMRDALLAWANDKSYNRYETSKNLGAAEERLITAIAALGDEWDRAVR